MLIPQGGKTPMTDAVGKRIRRLRQKHGLTLCALAAKTGVPTSSINAVEQGTRTGARLSLETGKKLALAWTFPRATRSLRGTDRYIYPSVLLLVCPLGRANRAGLV